MTTDPATTDLATTTVAATATATATATVMVMVMVMPAAAPAARTVGTAVAAALAPRVLATGAWLKNAACRLDGQVARQAVIARQQGPGHAALAVVEAGAAQCGCCSLQGKML